MKMVCAQAPMGPDRSRSSWGRVRPSHDPVRHLTLAAPDDAALMAAIARGETVAFERFYDRYASVVLATCLRILRDRAEAEDVLEEVFWEIWSRRSRYDASRSTPFGYLLTLARSRALDRLRFRKRRASVWLESQHADRAAPARSTGGGADPFEDTLAVQQRVALERALGELPSPHRRAVEMNFFEGLSHGEISEQLGDPLGTVKTRIRQGLLTLRKVLRSIDEPGRGDS
jgi:RNA polymerase sigma-70 factor (ECF subfamily)